MTVLGPLSGEPPEPMTAEDIERVRERVRAWFRGHVLVVRDDVLGLIAEVEWLQRRLRLVEHAVEPLVEALSGEPPHRHKRGRRV